MSHVAASLGGASAHQRLGARPPGLPDHIRQTTDWELLRREIYRRGMRFGEQLSFDFRELLTDAGNARRAGVLMWQLIRHRSPEVLVGPGFGATPLLYSIAIAALADGVNLQVLMVRDKRKEHNQKRWVEGHRPTAQGKRAVFVDDFMKRGSALPLVRQALAAERIDVDLVAVAVFFDMWEPLGSRQITVSTAPTLALFTRHDVGLTRDSFDALPPVMKGGSADFISAEPRWRTYKLNSKNEYASKCTPAISLDAIYVADDASRVWCHDRRSGDVRWSYQSLAKPKKGIVQLLQLADDDVVFACYDGTLTRLRGGSGEVVWRWKLDSSIHATPCFDRTRDRVFINTEQWNGGSPIGHLQCLDWQTGRTVWKVGHKWWPPGSPLFDAKLGLVYATCNDLSIIAVDASTGEVRWRNKTLGMVRGRPAMADGRLLVATERGRLQAFDGATGAVLWTRRYGLPLWHQFLHVHESDVFVMDGKWHFSAFDVGTGDLRWLSRLRSPGCWAPVPYGKYVVVLSKQGHVAVFSPDSEVKVWEGRIPGTYNQPPAIVNGCFVAASNDQGLLVYDIHRDYEH
jgi:outer membrane protein assembly factor BamB/orotate phosphoribosyltransferase